MELVYRRMTAGDLDLVMGIEQDIYPHPWTRGNFSDSLGAGYHCWILERSGVPVGYGVAEDDPTSGDRFLVATAIFLGLFAGFGFQQLPAPGLLFEAGTFGGFALTGGVEGADASVALILGKSTGSLATAC